jgi:hypothetical protein
MNTLYYAPTDETTIYLLCEIMQTLCLCYLVWRSP